MTAPQFGTVGMEVHELTGYATYVARALQTLQTTREWQSGDTNDMAVLFVRDSFAELHKVLQWFYEQGVKPRDIDLGAFV